MNKKKAIQITAVVLSVVLVAAIVIFITAGNDSMEPESSSDSISSSSSKPVTSEASSVQPSDESTSEETTKNTTKRNPEKPSSNGVDILVNAKNPIPDDWSVNLVQLKNGHQIDKRAYDSLQKMMDAARAKGWNPLICSSYRTTSYQQQLFDNRVQRMKNQGMSEKEAIKDTEKWIAIPGTSEHETGLAVDIVTAENQNLDNSQLNSDCQKWMMEHCYDYGFILRYPEDKVKITGIDFEPWHYRYVGYDIAQYIKQNGICLEEYKNK